MENASKTTAKAGHSVAKSAAKKTLLRPAPAVKSKKTSAVSKAVAKPPAKKAFPAKKPAAKKVAAKKVAPKQTVPKKAVVAKKAATPKKVIAPKKAPVKKVSASKSPIAKTISKNSAPKDSKSHHSAVVKPAAKPAATAAIRNVAAKPAKAPAKSAAKSSGKSAPIAVVKKVSPPPPSRLFEGKVASATAMVTSLPASSAASHASPHKKKSLSSSMNKLATKKLEHGVTREDGRYALPSTSTLTLPKGYRPSSDEDYMNPQHLAYFRNKLRDWRDQLVEESRQTMDNLREEVRDVGDEAERATRETENSLELRTRDRYRKLISKIDKALRRIEEGSYGFCEETDEEIGVDRLDARPIATLSLDAQERREHLQKQMGD